MYLFIIYLNRSLRALQNGKKNFKIRSQKPKLEQKKLQKRNLIKKAFTSVMYVFVIQRKSTTTG
jgi:hypothetical protein